MIELLFEGRVPLFDGNGYSSASGYSSFIVFGNTAKEIDHKASMVSEGLGMKDCRAVSIHQRDYYQGSSRMFQKYIDDKENDRHIR